MSKGGGSSVSTPQVGVYPQIQDLSSGAFEPLGTYGSEIMGGLGSLGNWATNLATGGNAQVNGTMPANGILSDSGSQVYSPFTSTGTTSGARNAVSPLSGLSSQQLGPFLSQAVQSILQAEGSTVDLKKLMKGLPGQAQNEFNQANNFQNEGNSLINGGTNLIGQGTGLIGQGTQTIGAGTNTYNQGEGLLNMATTGTGLFPSQQAMINQSVQAQQEQISQQLASAGLGASTQKVQLLGQISLSGAAAAGQLIQGNIQAANQTMGTGISEQQVGISQQQIGLGEQGIGISQQQLGLGAQQLGTTEQQIAQDTQKIDLAAQESLFNQYASITQMSSGLQQSLFTEGMQGYGMLGQMMNNTVNAFGYSLKGAEDVQQVMEFNAQLQMQGQQLAQSGQAAAAQGFSSMLGGLGSILGSGGSGSSGGILGGLGGILGSTGSAGAASLFSGGSALDAGITASGLSAGAGASAGTGLLGAIGGGLGGAASGIGAAISAIFASSCTAGRGVKGVNDIRWILFRDWILYRAPSFVRSAYMAHCDLINNLVSRNRYVRGVLLFLIEGVITYDQRTRAA